MTCENLFCSNESTRLFSPDVGGDVEVCDDCSERFPDEKTTEIEHTPETD